jgi:hypothetical protein
MSTISNLVALLCLVSSAAPCTWVVQRSACTASCGGHGVQQVDLLAPAGCDDVPPGKLFSRLEQPKP